jgi:DNA-binding NtrC family response regulator
VAAWDFREDLFYRLAVAVLTIPPLREREGDLTLLAEAQLKNMNDEHSQLGLPTRRLAPDARNRLRRHPWPGNVRELAATLRRAMLWANGEVLHASDIEAALLAPSSPKQEPVLQRRLGEGFKLDKLLLEVERQYLERALAEAKGNKTRAADLLGLRSHQVLGNRLRRAASSE